MGERPSARMVESAINVGDIKRESFQGKAKPPRINANRHDLAAEMERWLVRLRTADCDLSRSQPWQKRENLGHQGQGFIKLGAAGHEHDHRDLKFGGVLLKTQVAVCRQENIEFFLGQREQSAVFDAAPAHFLNGDAIMPGQRAAQTPVEAFVNENGHGQRFRAFSTGQLQ